MKYTPHIYQDHATKHVIENDFSGLFLEMGLGKTVSTLTAINELMFDRMEVNKVLVIAPKKVAEDTWTGESEKWDHLKHLRISLILGSEVKRKEAIKADADIYVINRENVAWLVGLYGTAFPFDMLVIDELSSFKSAKSIRFKALRQIRPRIKRVVGLTGTPAPNGLIDLWPQMYLLDQGERLGKTISGYRERYFSPGKRNGAIVYDYKIRPEAEESIFSKISDVCISMKAEDWLELPKRLDQNVEIHLSKKEMEQYEKFESEQILALANQEEITAINAAALTNKLLQYANGAVYLSDGSKTYMEVQNAKIEALKEDLEAANGKPFLLFYNFKHDAERIKKHLKEFKPKNLEGVADLKAWNNKEIPFLLAHPASAGHGLNMQHGGNLIGWFGLPWSLELYQQAVARLDRQGQTQSVINRRYITKGTMDEDVLRSLENKTGGQEALMQAVKARIEKYKKAMF
jgi:SNF2 family DNA or RNA helicase